MIDAQRAEEHRLRWRETLQREQLPEQRRAVVEEVRSALSSGDPRLTVAALRTVPWLGKDDVDRKELKERVEVFLIERNPAIRQSAVVAISTLDLGPGDLDILLPLAADADRNVRKEVPRALAAAQHGEIEGIAAEAFRHLLEDADLSVRLQTLRTLHGASSMASEVRDLVISLVESKNPEEARRALYALAGTKLEKDARIVTALVAALENEDPERRAEARRGLSHGVPDAYGPQISQVVAELLASQPELADRAGNVEMLKRHGTEAQIEALARLADDEDLPEVVRRSAREAIESIRNQ